MTDPETPNQPLLAAPSQPAVSAQGGRSTRAYKVTALTLLACVLIAGQAIIAYFLLSQRSDIKSLQDQSDNLESELTKGRSVAAPARMHIPMNVMPALMDFSVDEEASTEVPEKEAPLQSTMCQLEAAGVRAVAVPGFRPVCDEQGLYRVQQCFEKYCWCVNRVDGQQVPGSLRVGKASCGAFTGNKMLSLPNFN